MVRLLNWARCEVTLSGRVEIRVPHTNRRQPAVVNNARDSATDNHRRKSHKKQRVIYRFAKLVKK